MQDWTTRKSAKAAADSVLRMLKSAKKVAADLQQKESSKPSDCKCLEVHSFWTFCKKVATRPHFQSRQQKIPGSEEQGMKFQSLEFPDEISAWRIKQAHFLSASQMAKSQQIQGVQAVEVSASGGMKTSLLPTCCLRIAAQGYARRQVGSLSFRLPVAPIN